MTTQDRIERLREHCEYVMLHADSDGWTVVDLLHNTVGLSVNYRKGGKAEFTGSSIDDVLDHAYEDRS